MLGTARTARFAIVGFAAVALLVLGGLTWATVVSLRLERTTRDAHAATQEAQAQLDLRKSLEIARLHLESIILPVLMRESSREYGEYAPVGRREDHGSGEANSESRPRRIKDEDTESWIPLYFQVTDDLCWTSPQLSPATWPVHEHLLLDSCAHDEEPAQITCARADPSDPESVERQILLEQLARQYTSEDFAKRVAAVSRAATGQVTTDRMGSTMYVGGSP